jgi:predicted Zn-dependent peptidase
VQVHTKQSDQAHLRFGVPSYPIDHPDRYALGLLATVSRLFTEVRERRGLAYYVYGYNQGYTDTGTLFSQAGVDINRIDDAVTTIAGEFARIAAEPVDAEELEKARNYAKGRLILSLEDPKGMIMFGLRGEVLEDRVREPDEVLAGYDAVTAEDIQRVAIELVREERLNLALIGPFEDGSRFEPLLALSA